MNTNVKFKIGITILLLGGGTLMAIGMKDRFYSLPKQSAKADGRKQRYDPALLKEFIEISSGFDMGREEFMLGGTLSTEYAPVEERPNSSAEYLLVRKGNAFYYKLGAAETINAGGVSLYIDHISKKVLLSAEKRSVGPPPLPDAAGLIKNLDSEGYELKASTKGTLRTISFLNPMHVSCREYSVTFDTQSRQPVKIFMRMPSMETTNDKAENKMQLTITQSAGSAPESKLSTANIIKKQGDKWVLAEAYSRYELIRI